MKERKLGDVEYALEEGQVSENAPTEQHTRQTAYQTKSISRKGYKRMKLVREPYFIIVQEKTKHLYRKLKCKN